MGWRTIVVKAHAKLSYKNNYLIYKDAEIVEQIHLSEIDILLLERTDIVITTMLIKRLMDEKILVIICDDKRLPIAQVVPYYGSHNSSLQLAKQLQWETDRKVEVWTEIILQKMMNQASLLYQQDYTIKSESLGRLIHELQLNDPTNREGHAARIYFTTLFGSKFTRDDTNDINAALDYGYTLLLSLFAREIVSNGCLTQLGLKHTNQFNSFNLASDLMEPFRPLVDQIVYQNRYKVFVDLKRDLFQLFCKTYHYDKKEMFLSNIVSEYTKKVIKVLNGEKAEIPVFRL